MVGAAVVGALVGVAVVGAPVGAAFCAVAFSGSQADVSFGADDVAESEEMVFPEFIEALARCAINRWENVPGLTFRDKLSLAIEQVCELAHRPVANPKLPNRMKRAATEGTGARPSAIEMPSPLKAAGRSILA